MEKEFKDQVLNVWGERAAGYLEVGDAIACGGNAGLGRVRRCVEFSLGCSRRDIPA